MHYTKKIFAALSLFFLLTCKVSAQEFMVMGNNYIWGNTISYGTYNIDSCIFNLANISNVGYDIDFSFTSLSANYFYVIVSPYIFLPDTLFAYVEVSEYDGISGPDNWYRPRDFTYDSHFRAITCDYEGHLYAAGNGLSFYDATEDALYDPGDLPDEDFSSYIGDLPPQMQAGGALTYREGKLYLTTENNSLVEVNIETPMASEIVATFPVGTPQIDAMVTYPYRCDSIVTYAIGREDTTSILYILNFEDYSLTEICEMPLSVYGAAVFDECVMPPCELYVDLDIDDSSGLPDLDYQRDTICNAFRGIGDVDIEVYSAIKMDSILIELLNPMDIGQENLWLTGNTAINVYGSGSTTLMLVNNGTAEMIDFKFLLDDVFYHNTAPNPTVGQREIVVLPHALFYTGVPSMSYFTIEEVLINSEEQHILPSCYGETDGSISLLPSGTIPPYTANWNDGQSGLTAMNLSAGEVSYTLIDSIGCEQEYLTLLEQPDSLSVYVTTELDTICAGTPTLLEASPLGGTSPYQYLWNDGSEETQLSVNGEGPHTLLVTDENGCTDTVSIELTVIDTIFVQQENILCKGEIFEWQNMSFSSDTLVCIGFNSFLGCDSIHCMNIQFLDTTLITENISLCEGDFFETGNQLYFSDTTFCQVLTGANGCDSTYCLDLQFTERDVFLFETICEGESYSFGGENLTATGIYVDSLTGSNGCDSLVVLELSFQIPTEIIFEVNGNFCIDEEVMVTVNGFTNYQWSTGEQSENVTFDVPGVYALTAIDENGCATTDNILLEDTALEIFYTAAPPLCYDSEEGFIQIDSVRNARLPIEFILNGVSQENKPYFESLGLGMYEIEAIDADGCRAIITTELLGPQELQLELPDNQTITLGDTISLPVNINFQAFDLQWNPPLFMACDTCLQTYFWPSVSTYYELSTVDAEGCAISQGVWLFVKKEAPVFIPNAFSPNDDGINDYFTIFTHPSISILKSVQIFNRWGGLVYQEKNIPPNIEYYGWNGKTNGKINPTGVYVCTVEITYLDGRSEVLTQELLLMK